MAIPYLRVITCVHLASLVEWDRNKKNQQCLVSTWILQWLLPYHGSFKILTFLADIFSYFFSASWSHRNWLLRLWMWFRTQVTGTVRNYWSISHTHESLKPGLRHITNVLQPSVRFYDCLSSGSYIKTNIHKCIRPFINMSLTRFKLIDTRPKICLIKHFRKWRISLTKRSR
jgi:hypothetical protein